MSAQIHPRAGHWQDELVEWTAFDDNDDPPRVLRSVNDTGLEPVLNKSTAVEPQPEVVDHNPVSQLRGDSPIEAVDGGYYVIEPSLGWTNNQPILLRAPAAGSFASDISTPGTHLIISNAADAEVSLGVATDLNGQVMNTSGSTYQLADTYRGNVVINLGEATVDGIHRVDMAIETETGTLADNAPPTQVRFDYYINSGAGDDQATGTRGNDFIRMGAGHDRFAAGAGDDLVRGGAGDDAGTLGPGNDWFYLTIDQLQGQSINTLSDFDTAGDDRIVIDAALKDRVDISMSEDGQSVVIRLSGSESGLTEVLSEGGSIDTDDLEFL